MLTENDILRIASRIAQYYAPLVVGVFGSYGVGAASEHSDLDLFIIKRCSERSSARRLAVRRLLIGVIHPLDIHVFTPDEFEEAAHERLSFAWVIVRQARVYHVTEEARRCVPCLFEQDASALHRASTHSAALASISSTSPKLEQ
jgi:predicted nucleotidyltransferase